MMEKEQHPLDLKYRRQMAFIMVLLKAYPQWLNTKQIVISLELPLEAHNYRMVNRHMQMLSKIGFIEYKSDPFYRNNRLHRLSPETVADFAKLKTSWSNEMSLTKLVKMSIMGDAPSMEDSSRQHIKQSKNTCLFYRNGDTPVAGHYLIVADNAGNENHRAVGFDGKEIFGVYRYVECPSPTCEKSDVVEVQLFGGCVEHVQLFSEVKVEPMDYVLRDHDADQTLFRSRDDKRNHGPINHGDSHEKLFDEMVAHTQFVQVHC